MSNVIVFPSPWALKGKISSVMVMICRHIDIGHRLLKYIDYLMLNTQIRLINEYVYRVFSVVYGSAGIGRVRLNLLVH